MVLNLDHILDSEKNYFFADLFLAVLDPCCCVGFFLAVVSGDSSLVWASDWGGFSYCRARLQGKQTSVAEAPGLERGLSSRGSRP